MFINIVDIMRSNDYWSFMEKRYKKVKRLRIDWFTVLVKQHNQDMKDYFFNIVEGKYGRKRFSFNRAAYCTLRHFYSTTTIRDLAKKVGVL